MGSSLPPSTRLVINLNSGRIGEKFYPVLTLPDELIIQIFMSYIPPYPEHPPIAGPGSPTCLLGICRLWRSIALHSPSLWRAIHLSRLARRESIQTVETWLHRSRDLPLSLHFDLKTSMGPTCDDQLLKILLQHRSRWEYVDLRVIRPQIAPLFGSAPFLIHLSLLCWDKWYDDDDDTKFGSITAQDTPSLRSLSLWDVGHDVESLPWAQLTCLTLFDIVFSQCAPILAASPNLCRCKLVLTMDHRQAVHVNLPELEAMVLQVDDGVRGPVESCLAHFTLPALRNLEIHPGLLSQPIEQLQSLISRSECPLRRVRIPGSSEASLLQPAFPNIEIDFIQTVRLRYDDERWKTEEYWRKTA
ncbi:hypothetical protein MIND_01104400 [Mycena indigotica]|uniref:F-box domain-containing protein n=1 Tax=Mycena indigotica TaxID=2126181 RepID=A0A8H6SAZ7_9AGAR|nr:uncharacterized protein MIND_01104400 [Mycena indigotica]KAF7295642.1 hypothetical protein MIND_01104400 [Mycena indigotica]